VIQAKPAEDPAHVRYVIRNPEGLYYDGHDETGIPGFKSRDIMFAVKYGDVESIETMIKTHKKLCIDRDLPGDLFDTCDVLTTHT
jgi:hypothetical protein